MSVRMGLDEAVELALRHASSLGVSGVEVYGSHYKRLTINASQGRIKSVLYNDESGIGIRLSLEGRVVFSYLNTLDASSIRSFVEKTYRALRSSPVDPMFKGFYPPDGEYNIPRDIYFPSIAVKLSDPTDLIENIRSAVSEFDTDKFKVTWLYAGIGEAKQVIANSEGVFEEASTTFARMFADTIAVDGSNRSPSVYEAEGWRNRIPDPVKLLSKARDKAFRSLKREKLDLSGEFNVILTPEGFIELFNATYGEALLGVSYVNKSSPFRDKLDEQIAPECFTVIDNPQAPGKMGSIPFDGEGAPTYTKKVIDRGVLKTFLFNHYYAQIAGVHTTGNASRAGYTSPPGISWSNIEIEPGEARLEELLEEGNVILVERIQGVFNAKFQTGDYGGAGTPSWFYRKGGEEISLGSISVSGNIYSDLLKQCTATREAEDKGSLRAPYIMFKAKVHQIG
ncbi:MAG: TldD/PmbA family protein [Desulfurococcales archaeon]|nr:TldD/PmbA family protein [Desulfurococcales archaeon]